LLFYNFIEGVHHELGKKHIFTVNIINFIKLRKTCCLCPGQHAAYAASYFTYQGFETSSLTYVKIN